MKRQSTTAFGVRPMGAMPGEPSTTTESRSSEGDQTSTCMLNPGGVGNATACETSMWEEWTQATSTEDEVSTSNFLPELTSSTTSRLSFQQSDMMATWMSSFHPLTHSSMSPDLPPASVVVDVAASLMHEPGLALDPSAVEEDAAAQAFPVGYAKATSHRQMRRGGALGPLSPSSPLAIQNGLLNPLGDPWDSCPSTLQWSTVTTTGQPYNNNNNYGPSCRNVSFNPDHSSTVIDHLESTGYSALSRPRHTDIFIGPNGTFESSTPGGWTPQLMYDATSETTVGSSMTPMKLMASLLEAGEATSSDVCSERKQQRAEGPAEIGLVRDRVSRPGISESASQGFSTVTISSILADCKRSDEESSMATQLVWPRKHRLELVELVDGEEDMQNNSPSLLKRPKTDSVELAKAWQWSDQTLRGADLRSSYPSSSSLAAAASEAMQIIAIGPALNTNGKPRARRGSATDPQSVYARHRREKINERLKILQNLVPNGAKVDIVTMLDEAIHYVKFLQHQVEKLKSDDEWMYATPNNYSGMDLPDLCPRSQELESSAS